MRGAKLSSGETALDQPAHYVADLDQAERDLFHRVEAALADGVGVLEERVELRHLARAKEDRVERHAQPQRVRPVERVAGAALGVERELDQRAAQGRRGDTLPAWSRRSRGPVARRAGRASSRS